MFRSAFIRPASLAELLEALHQHREGGVLVNGGTDMVERIACGAVRPTAIIHMHDIAELNYIREAEGHWLLGGAVTYQSMLASALPFEGLRQALREIGSPPIRVRGTPAGNIGTAVPGGDCNVALMALDAVVVLACKDGERHIALRDIFVGVGKTRMEAGECIREIRIPCTAGQSGFVKLAKRKSQDIAQVSACVRVEVQDGLCAHAAVALGAVAPTPVRSPSLEACINGKSPQDAMAALKGRVPDEASMRNPRNRAYKEAVVGVAVARALHKALNPFGPEAVRP